MQHRTVRGCILIGILAGVLGVVQSALPQTNSWINASDGKWETGTNWSSSVPPSTDLYGALITNASSKVVTIDAVTASNYPGSMSISNLTVSAPAGATNTLLLSATGSTPLNVYNRVTILTGGLIDIENSSLQFGVPPSLGNGSNLTVDGTLFLGNGGAIIISNPPSYQTSNNELVNELIVGCNATGQMTVSTGTVACTGGGEGIAVGYNANSQGTLTVLDGASLTNLAAIAVGQSANSQGAVWMTGGQLVATDTVYQETGGSSPGYSIVGNSGEGQLTISNGTAILGETYVGYSYGSQGTLTLAGGSLTVVSSLNVGAGGGVAAMWVTGGQLTTTNPIGQPTGVSGIFVDAGMVISNGTVSTGVFGVGINGPGTLTVAGGNVTTSNLDIGSSSTLWITGGQVSTGTGQSNSVNVSGNMIVSNGTVSAGLVSVGDQSGEGGEALTIAGGNVAACNLNISGRSASASLNGGQLIVTNGTTVIGGYGGTLTVTGGTLQDLSMLVGQTAVDSGLYDYGSLIISGGTISIWSNLVMGDCAAAFEIVDVTVTNTGSLFVTNASHTAFLDVLSGTLTVASGGMVKVDTLLMTNSCGQLVISNGTLSACGTINGNVVIAPGSTVLADCGGTLTFDGVVTNNGTMLAMNGSTLEAYGLVINNGIIDIRGGTTNFQGGFVNNGVVVTTSNLPVVTAMDMVGTDIYISVNTGNGGQYVFEDATDLIGTNWTPVVGFTGTGGVITFIDPGAATLQRRFYRIGLIPTL